MKNFLIVFILALIIPNFKTEEKNCWMIDPEKKSDCKLSRDDVTYSSYRYCCYEKYNYINKYKCEPYTESEYKKKYGDSIVENCNIRGTTSNGNGCEDITPNSKSDCVLKEVDKQDGYEYCCYFVDDEGKKCYSETKETYALGKAIFDEFKEEGDIYDCGINEDIGGYFSLSKLFYVLVILINI